MFIVFFAVVVMPAVFTMVQNTTGPQLTPVVTSVEYTFNGTLGMVTYGHSWFGLGGADSTAMSFQNGTAITTFNFNKDIAANIGQQYEVMYKITYTNYYNVTTKDQKSYFGPYSNSTSGIEPQSVIWISDP